MALEHTQSRMELFTREAGCMTARKDTERLLMQMAMFTKELSCKIRLEELQFLILFSVVYGHKHGMSINNL